MVMSNGSRALAGLLAALAAPLALAGPVQWPVSEGGNGHYYEYVAAPGIGWTDASAAAEASTKFGKQGHLATLTSEGEDAFVEANVRPQGDNAEAWIGGIQDVESCTVLGPETCWFWVNGEGEIPGTNAGPGYARWAPGEPNDAGNGESYLGVWDAGWNDEANLANIQGYIVEYDYDGTVDAGDCTGGCNPSGVQLVTLPGTAVLGPDAKLTQALVKNDDGTVEFLDPRVDGLGQCWDRRALDVFGELGGGDPGALILPAYLCGSPAFSVVLSTATGISIPSGVVRSEQFPEQIFDVDERFECEGAVGDTDLQRRGVFAWQPDDRTDVVEGHTLELTNGCGSSKGVTKGLSYFVLNLHLDCGIDFGTNDAAVTQCFVALVMDKYAALEQSLQDAKPFLTSPNYGALQSQLSSSRAGFQGGQYGKALQRLSVFKGRIESAAFVDPSGFNHQGNLQMRAENILFTIQEKLDTN